MFYSGAVKKSLYILIIIVSVLTACIDRREYASMRQGLDSLNERNRNDEPFTAADVQPYIDYFDRHGEPNDKMLAYYMMGSVYRDEGNAPMALNYFRIATEQADTTSDICDFRTLSRIYGQIATVFNLQRAPSMEIEAERRAVNFAWKAKDTLAAITFYESLCLPYHMLNKMDSALFYSQESAKLYRRLGHYEKAAGTLGMNIDIYLRMKDFDKVKNAMDEYEAKSTFFDDDGNIRPGGEIFYYYKGSYYEGIGRLDSAEVFYRRLLQSNFNIDNEEAAYKGLLSLYRKIGNNDSIAKYSELYCQMNDSASFAHSADEITRMNALYNYDESMRRAAQNEEMAMNYRNTIIALLVLFLIASYFIYRFVTWQKKVKKQQLIKANTEYSSLLLQYNKVQQEVNLFKEDQDRFNEEKEREILELKNKVLYYQEIPQIVNNWTIEQAMLSNPIIQELHHLASKAVKPSKAQWKDFREFTEKEIPDFIEKLNSKEASLTYQEVLIGLLIRLQFSQGEQASLLGVSKQRINNLKRSLNKKLFGEEGAITLNNNIINL